MSMKLPTMFHQNPPHTLDKIVAEHISMKKQSQSLTLSSNVKVIAKTERYQPREQKTCHP